MNRQKTDKVSWGKRNPERMKIIQNRYYKKNTIEAKLRSKIQHMKGKYAWELLSDSQREIIQKKIYQEVIKNG